MSSPNTTTVKTTSREIKKWSVGRGSMQVDLEWSSDNPNTVVATTLYPLSDIGDEQFECMGVSVKNSIVSELGGDWEPGNEEVDPSDGRHSCGYVRCAKV